MLCLIWQIVLDGIAGGVICRLHDKTNEADMLLTVSRIIQVGSVAAMGAAMGLGYAVSVHHQTLLVAANCAIFVANFANFFLQRMIIRRLTGEN